MAERELRTASTIEEANKVGFLGTEVDPTPDKNYTVAGVTKGAPTPETDEKSAAEAEKRAEELTNKVPGKKNK